MLSRQFLLLALSNISSAHFILHWPPTAGFVDETQSDGPCGGIDVAVDATSQELNVDRFAVNIQNTHPRAQWQFRGTLDTKAPYNSDHRNNLHWLLLLELHERAQRVRGPAGYRTSHRFG